MFIGITIGVAIAFWFIGWGCCYRIKTKPIEIRLCENEDRARRENKDLNFKIGSLEKERDFAKSELHLYEDALQRKCSKLCDGCEHLSISTGHFSESPDFDGRWYSLSYGRDIYFKHHICKLNNPCPDKKYPAQDSECKANKE